MRRLTALGILLLLLPGAAHAECAGTDLMVQLSRDDPAAHAEVLERGGAVPNGEGRFWRVERAGVPPSFLFGTFHTTGLGPDTLPPEVGEAMTGARLMLVELTPEEEAAMQARIASDPAFILTQGDNGVISALSEAEKTAAGARLAERGIALPIAARLKPWMLFTVLAVPACVIEEAQQGKQLLDKALVAEAAAAGVPVRGLETYEEALGALIDLPPDIMQALLLDMLRQPAGEEDVWRTTSNLYMSGEIATIWEFSRVEAEKSLGPERSAEAFAAFADNLLVMRNQAWMDILEPALSDGNVFAAFGAMHLVGETGIVELLRGQGYTVTRVDG